MPESFLDKVIIIMISSPEDNVSDVVQDRISIKLQTGLIRMNPKGWCGYRYLIDSKR